MASPKVRALARYLAPVASRYYCLPHLPMFWMVLPLCGSPMVRGALGGGKPPQGGSPTPFLSLGWWAPLLGPCGLGYCP